MPEFGYPAAAPVGTPAAAERVLAWLRLGSLGISYLFTVVYDTANRVRPLARRFLNTRRPFFVLIRLRNPCVRFRRRLFGWYVRFMMPRLLERLGPGENLNFKAENLTS